MPNQHYITIDMTKMGLTNKDEVSSVITTTKFSSHEIYLVTDLYFSPHRFFLPWITLQATSQGQCAGNSKPSCEGTYTSRKCCCCDLHINLNKLLNRKVNLITRQKSREQKLP